MEYYSSKFIEFWFLGKAILKHNSTQSYVLCFIYTKKIPKANLYYVELALSVKTCVAVALRHVLV